MSVHQHVLDPVRDAAFLARGLVDPFSGVPFRAPSALVFCAACGSPFLRETWDAIGGRHCEQTETLAFIPDDADAVPVVPDLEPSPVPQVRPATAPSAALISPVEDPTRQRYEAPMLLTLPVQPAGVAYRNRPGALNPRPGEVLNVPPVVADPISFPPPPGAHSRSESAGSGRLAGPAGSGRGAGFAILGIILGCIVIAWLGSRWWNGDGAGGASPTQQSAETPAPLQATLLELGSHTGHITGADELDAEGRPTETFAFEGTGDDVTIRLLARFAPRLTVVTPSGDHMLATADSTAGEAILNIPGGSGLFTITVAPVNASDRGAFEINIESRDGVQDIELDAEISGTLSGAASDGRYRRRYRLQAEEGVVLSIALDAGFVPGVEVEGPEGPLLMRGGLGGQVVQFVPRRSGTHVLEISAKADEPAGVFRFVVSTDGTASLGPRRPSENAEEILAPAEEVAVNKAGEASAPAVRPTSPSRPAAPAQTAPQRRTTVQPTRPQARRPAARSPSAPRRSAAPRPATRRQARGTPAVADIRGFSRGTTQAPTPRSQGFSGVGMYRVVVSGPGEVMDVRVERPSGNPVADAEALRTLRTWRFERGRRLEVGVVVFEFLP